ncbi:MAG: hypothetical protein CVV49_15415 [Spirochaetae bacterium HGW-Spirochaetae-5]|nr:MAG: hypothetical protein CVV49_15415 [Spirochaetae bacterium HGW-Spirochaetae-5]
MKRLLEITGDLRYAFRLILASAVIMAIGSIYASIHYSFFNSMNGVPLIDWYMTKGVEKLSITWWIPLLFFSFSLLGINTFACTLNRIMSLVPRRKNLGTKRFSVLISPSVIHILFLGMLAGHFLSFTAVTQEKIPFSEGDNIYLNGIGDVKVTALRNEFFPESSMLSRRIKQTTVSISINDNGTDITKNISFLEPAVIKGTIVQLDMEKKKDNRIEKPSPADETCNKEKKFHYADTTAQVNPQLYFLLTRDPGLFILLPGFFIVIIIMGWYFYQTNFSKNNKDFMENENEIITV